jgi:hypothetical protein
MEGELAALREQYFLLKSQKAAPIPEDKLKKMIMLCHPDKHNGSKTSTEITQWLLSLRK